jgi:orotidine-5'-phosphate decarboxylase
MTGSVEDLVARRAGRARDLQCDGVVASGLEAARLRRELGPDLLIVTPGIRPTPSDYATSPESRPDDQKRVMTARQAFLNGADHIVVGRPISRAQDPLAVVAAMQQEIHDVLG